jgi:anti-sigma factor RsiW
MKCNKAKSLFSSFMDGAVSGAQMHAVSAHLQSCEACSAQYRSLADTQTLVSKLGRKQPPRDLALQLRLALSREMASARRSRLQIFADRISDACNSLMLPATGGLVAAVVMFCALIGFFALPPNVSAANDDVPTALYTPPKLAASPFAESVTDGGPVVVEVSVDATGRMEDYRIISGQDSPKLRSELERTLIFTQFEPAMSFGQPAAGKVVISFANVSVKG